MAGRGAEETSLNISVNLIFYNDISQAPFCPFFVTEPVFSVFKALDVAECLIPPPCPHPKFDVGFFGTIFRPEVAPEVEAKKRKFVFRIGSRTKLLPRRPLLEKYP